MGKNSKYRNQPMKNLRIRCCSYKRDRSQQLLIGCIRFRLRFVIVKTNEGIFCKKSDPINFAHCSNACEVWGNRIITK